MWRSTIVIFMSTGVFVWQVSRKWANLLTNKQCRRQGLMVGEAHLVGETNIFNVKYIIHEYGLPTICRPPPGGYLLGRYTYTGLQHFLGQAQLLDAMCVKKRKRSNKHTYLTILSPPSQTALPINHQRVHCKALPFVFLHHPVQILPAPAKQSASAMRHSGTEMLQL